MATYSTKDFERMCHKEFADRLPAFKKLLDDKLQEVLDRTDAMLDSKFQSTWLSTPIQYEPDQELIKRLASDHFDELQARIENKFEAVIDEVVVTLNSVVKRMELRFQSSEKEKHEPGL